MVFRRIVSLVIHPEDHRVVRIRGGRGDQDLLYGSANMLSRFSAICKKPGRFDHYHRTNRCPVQIPRILRLENLETLTVDGDRIVRMGYFVRKIAQDRIVL